MPTFPPWPLFAHNRGHLLGSFNFHWPLSAEWRHFCHVLSCAFLHVQGNLVCSLLRFPSSMGWPFWSVGSVVTTQGSRCSIPACLSDIFICSTLWGNAGTVPFLTPIARCGQTEHHPHVAVFIYGIRGQQSDIRCKSSPDPKILKATSKSRVTRITCCTEHNYGYQILK